MMTIRKKTLRAARRPQGETPMVIFHILKYAYHGAGNVYAVIDLACIQAQCGHKVYICSSASHFDEFLKQHGVEYIEIDQLGGIGATLSALLKLYNTLRRIKPDIVHAHMMKSTLLAAALRPILKFGLVTSVHNEFQRSAILMRLGDRVIGVSEAVSRSMIKRGVPPSKMRTVLNGTIGSVRRPPPLPQAADLARPAIVTVCGMHPRKGIPDLIAAYGIVAAKCPQARLYLVGSGPMLENYMKLAAETAPDGIVFLGHMDDPRPVLLGSDIFVLASHAEPAGLVLSEARELRCAIVATEVGGIPEMLANGKAGILVPPRRPDLLANAIARLLEDPAFNAHMRESTQIDIGHLTMQRVAADTEKVYAELLEQ
jgi:glycosyltransferase involved in cell wall biosynthesis